MPAQTPDTEPAYAELHCLSNFSFLRGASHAEELAMRAHALGYTALAVTDECSLAGVVRAHAAFKALAEDGEAPPPVLIVGAEFTLAEGMRLVLLVGDRAGYGALCALITRGRRRAPKGSYELCAADVAELACDGWLGLLLPADVEADENHARWLAGLLPARAWIAVELHRSGGERARLQRLRQLSARSGVPLVAAGDVHMHTRARRALQDTLTAIRLRCRLPEAGLALFPNGERHLRPRARLARLYPPDLLAQTLVVAARCRFSLDVLRYEYPEEIVPAGETPAGYLRRLVEAGAARRWPDGVPDKARRLVEHELALIAELGYERYFLTVYDLVRFARQRGILCQGRGSAANSAVCFCLHITEVDPARMNMLFERFISRERNEPPDIDVDFEHQRREEVIQYVYRRYGRERAALAATVITYRAKSALRDVGKALGLELAQVDRLSQSLAWWDGRAVIPERLAELGFDPAAPVMRRLVTLVDELIGFPRHLSQHVGGFVIARDTLAELVPVENAAMADRTVIQWDKDDLDTLGLLKVDVLALGMLSAIRRALQMVGAFRGEPLRMADVPAEDPAVYDMLCHADTVGVFQIESRAQMAMLPRLRPRCFYDLVIEVAIVRPGPIQGGMVHPYLRRRQGLEPVEFPSAEVRGVLERTLGVPIFQEQVMRLAVVAAGFTPGEADSLRRAMAAFRKRGSLGPFEQRLTEGMRERGYAEEFAKAIYEQIKGFGEYGFPESHSASFALLVYVSAWLKRHHPAAFCAALLNSQPMGFYAPAQLVADARRHGVEVRAVDVRHSDWDCTLERGRAGTPVLRLGLRMVKGLAETAAGRVVAARQGGAAVLPGHSSSNKALVAGRTSASPFRDVEDLAARADLGAGELERLAAAGALAGLAGHRHHARWQALGMETPLPTLPDMRRAEGAPLLRAPAEGEDIVADYAATGLTLGRHPLALLRERLDRMRVATAERVREAAHGERLHAVGLVINRQRPSTASGVLFMTLEDETGHVNVVVWASVQERQRRVLLGARLMRVAGSIEREGEVVHLVATRLADLTPLLGELQTRSRDFR